ncbi:hypothetical protein IWQ62_001630 [Dispira parvispora]|uniref:Uncharacterized protein n=1 Tax=Dispira parvispora TaxID=1520584 RepID=A0A9W8E8U9_9FUNG|nr:hypothetical protein IWQ62_001630 [Dispira parvispora]
MPCNNEILTAPFRLLPSPALKRIPLEMGICTRAAVNPENTTVTVALVAMVVSKVLPVLLVKMALVANKALKVLLVKKALVANKALKVLLVKMVLVAMVVSNLLTVQLVKMVLVVMVVSKILAVLLVKMALVAMVVGNLLTVQLVKMVLVVMVVSKILAVLLVKMALVAIVVSNLLAVQLVKMVLVDMAITISPHTNMGVLKDKVAVATIGGTLYHGIIVVLLARKSALEVLMAQMIMIALMATKGQVVPVTKVTLKVLETKGYTLFKDEPRFISWYNDMDIV